MVFHTGPYFASTGTEAFYPLVEVGWRASALLTRQITFNYTDPTQHYHIPLLISPFSYTTYRGS
jgi:5-hydroxyisourate hydrolase